MEEQQDGGKAARLALVPGSSQRWRFWTAFPSWHTPLAWCSRAATKVSDTDPCSCSTSDTSVQPGSAGS